MALVMVSIVPRTFSSSFKQGTKKLTSIASPVPCSADQGLTSGSITVPAGGASRRANGGQQRDAKRFGIAGMRQVRLAVPLARPQLCSVLGRARCVRNPVVEAFDGVK